MKFFWHTFLVELCEHLEAGIFKESLEMGICPHDWEVLFINYETLQVDVFFDENQALSSFTSIWFRWLESIASSLNEVYTICVGAVTEAPLNPYTIVIPFEFKVLQPTGVKLADLGNIFSGPFYETRCGFHKVDLLESRQQGHLGDSSDTCSTVESVLPPRDQVFELVDSGAWSFEVLVTNTFITAEDPVNCWRLRIPILHGSLIPSIFAANSGFGDRGILKFDDVWVKLLIPCLVDGRVFTVACFVDAHKFELLHFSLSSCYHI